jgi:hypothetical protein
MVEVRTSTVPSDIKKKLRFTFVLQAALGFGPLSNAVLDSVSSGSAWLTSAVT